MNRLTDALYMVRFKVRPGVHASDQSSLVEREEGSSHRVDPSTPPFWQQTLAEMKGAGQHLQYLAPDSSSPGSVAPWSAEHATGWV